MALRAVITDYEYPSIETERNIITGAGFELADYQAAGEDELIAATRDADAVIVQYAAITRAVIEKMTRCKMIIKYGVGYNNIDVEAAAEHGIYVCNVPDSAIDEVSNHAVAMILALSRKLTEADRALKRGEWGNKPFAPLYRLAGKTVGIVGIGALGGQVARKLAGFDVTLVAFDPAVAQAAVPGVQVEMVSLDDLCRRSDYVTLHCPLNKHTEGMFDRGRFAMMKKGACLVNTARGAVVRETDLIGALESGHLAGAGLDVFEREPLDSSSRLLSLPNVIATGHVAWYSEDSIAVLQRKAAEEVVNVLRGNKPFNPCNEPRAVR